MVSVYLFEEHFGNVVFINTVVIHVQVCPKFSMKRQEINGVPNNCSLVFRKNPILTTKGLEIDLVRWDVY